MNDIRPPRPRVSVPERPKPSPSHAAGFSLPQPLANPDTSPGLPPIKDEPILQPSKKTSKKKWWLLGILTVVILLVAGALGSYAWYRDGLTSRSSDTTQIKITVADGATTEQIANDLQTKGVIKNSFIFMLYVRIHNRSDIKAGSYVFTAAQTVREIISVLNSGDVDTLQITILPGLTLAEIKDNLVKNGFSPDEIDQAFAKKYDHPLLASKPTKATLEGYIFPETYFMEGDASVEDILLRSFDEFEKRLKEDTIRERLKKRGFSVHQGVILGSIIIKEVNNQQDFKQVSQVFTKRLNEDIPLGSDPTYKYAAKQLGVAATPTLDSPYNTRIHKGLPPGPIANVTSDVLEAIIKPASGDYLFFVAGDDGRTHYSHTQAQHDDNIRKFCTTLCFSE